MTRRYLSNLLWRFQLWRMRRQRSPEHIALERMIDEARRLHRPVSHLQKRLHDCVSKGLRA
jgi:hypothetical protein